MITAIILNYNRPKYLKNNVLSFLEKYSLISEILVSHGKEETYFDTPTFRKTKHLKHWDLNKEYGLSLRFYTSKEAKNDILLIMDDDIYPTEETLHYLYTKYVENPKSIHGIYGRELDKNNEYNTRLCTGDCDIILTRLMICNKEMCDNFMIHRESFEKQIVKNSKPFWNGEDIIFNLINIKYNEVYGKGYKLPHYNRIDLNGISFGKEHLNYRKKITVDTIKKLDLNLDKNKNNKLSSNAIYEINNSYLPFYFIFLIMFIICLFVLIKNYKKLI